MTKMKQTNFHNNPLGGLAEKLMQKKSGAKSKSVEENDRKKRIYVGIDFGTSFTKVCYQVLDGSGRAPVVMKFDTADGFLPSTLQYDQKEKLLFFGVNPQGSQNLAYFKFGMIDKILRKKSRLSGCELNLPDFKKDFSAEVSKDAFLCSVYYVANVILESKIRILEKTKIEENSVSMVFQMGCPIDNFKRENKGVYDRVLWLAHKLSLDLKLKEGMRVEDLCAFCQEHWNENGGENQTIPELYAEASEFIQNPKTGDGFYGLLDIGGGTVDFAVMRIKMSNGEKQIEFLSRGVLPLGVEMLLERFYLKPYEEKKKLFFMRPAEFKKVMHGSNAWKQLPERLKAPYEFRIGFFKEYNDVALKTPSLKRQNVMYLFMYGGGADCQWYKSIVDEHNKNLGDYRIPKLIPTQKLPNLQLPEESRRTIVARNLASIHDFDASDPDNVRFERAFEKPLKKGPNPKNSGWETTYHLADVG